MQMSPNSHQRFRIRKLSAEAVRLYRDEHPNPDRVGCPPFSVLEQLANFSEDQDAPDQHVVFHVFSECYPCYNDLLQLRAKQQK